MLDLPKIGWNEDYALTVIKITENWIVAVMPMIFNDRVILMDHLTWQTTIVAGFCYPRNRSPQAVDAAIEWDPETEREPKDYVKVAFDAR